MFLSFGVLTRLVAAFPGLATGKQRTLRNADEMLVSPNVLISRAVTPPSGTFLAKVRDGLIQFPKPIYAWCERSGWTLFRVEIVDEDRLELTPVLGDDEFDAPGEHVSSLSSDGRLWIPGLLRGMVGMGEQLVMMRIESGSIGVFLRKVFETLGFGP